MDRNTIIGFSLIFLILAGYYWYTAPTPEQAAQMQRTQDSLAKVEQLNAEKVKKAEELTANASDSLRSSSDSSNVISANNNSAFQQPVVASISPETLKNIVIENEQLLVSIAPKGGTISQVQLMEFKRSDSSELVLLDAQKNKMVWQWNDEKGNPLNSDQFIWQVIAKTKNTAILRLKINDSSYIQQSYSLDIKKPYQVDYKVEVVGMDKYIRRGNSDFKFTWNATLQKQERDMKWETQNAAIVYKLPDESPTTLTSTEEATETLKNKVQWVAFKQQYFSSIISSPSDILTDAKLSMGLNKPSDSLDVKPVGVQLFSAYNGEANRKIDFEFYFGPNQYNTLENVDFGIKEASVERIIPMGWGIFGWVNRGLVLPIFTFLEGIIGNAGIMIMLLTIIIKTMLLPLVYKSYISTAKMRILKPEMDAIKEKHNNDLQKVQAENMALYKKAGVSPLSGCVPMLLQLPILFAMFQFFPHAFELRQKTFLWSHDLSQWDGPLLGFNIPFYGDHVSFFTLLMTASTLIYTHLNNQISGVTGQMKWMGYLMPIIFLGVLNDYASGLTWYYFVSNMITFGQQWAIRKMVDDDKLHKQIAEARKKPVKKSAFQQRMEEAMKASQARSKKK
jgi:YidC/Oxa1 family membrane protein insertase